MSGLTKYLSEDETQNFVVEVMTDEAIKTSEIEGEYLNRKSVRSSILYNIGLTPHKYPVQPAEHGIAAMFSYKKTLVNLFLIKCFLTGIR